jgi:hypothetical protein
LPPANFRSKSLLRLARVTEDLYANERWRMRSTQVVTHPAGELVPGLNLRHHPPNTIRLS